MSSSWTPTYRVQKDDRFEVGRRFTPQPTYDFIRVLFRRQPKLEIWMDEFKFKMLLREMLMWYFEDEPHGDVKELIERLREAS